MIFWVATLYSRESLRSQIYVSPPPTSSGSETKPGKKPAEVGGMWKILPELGQSRHKRNREGISGGVTIIRELRSNESEGNSSSVGL
jgi:hypothetical protein